jgi:hypothetical protein
MLHARGASDGRHEPLEITDIHAVYLRRLVVRYRQQIALKGNR